MAIHIEMMDENYLRADILGISLADEDRTLFIPLAVAEQSDVFKKWLQMQIKRNMLLIQKRHLHLWHASVSIFEWIRI